MASSFSGYLATGLSRRVFRRVLTVRIVAPWLACGAGLYRVAQEALANVPRPARFGCAVRLQFDAGGVRLEIMITARGSICITADPNGYGLQSSASVWRV